MPEQRLTASAAELCEDARAGKKEEKKKKKERGDWGDKEKRCTACGGYLLA